MSERDTLLALMIRTPEEPGALNALTSVILEHNANITYVDIAERREGESTVYFELEAVAGEAADALVGDLGGCRPYERSSEHPLFRRCTAGASSSWAV
jgi:energy-converting hydrogenase B subunit Q